MQKEIVTLSELINPLLCIKFHCFHNGQTVTPFSQWSNCNNCSSSGALFYHKVAPVPSPELLDTTAPAPLVKNLSSSMLVQFEVSSF